MSAAWSKRTRLAKEQMRRANRDLEPAPRRAGTFASHAYSEQAITDRKTEQKAHQLTYAELAARIADRDEPGDQAQP